MKSKKNHKCRTINSTSVKVRVAQEGRGFRAREKALNHATIRSDFGAYAFANIDV